MNQRNQNKIKKKRKEKYKKCMCFLCFKFKNGQNSKKHINVWGWESYIVFFFKSLKPSSYPTKSLPYLSKKIGLPTLALSYWIWKRSPSKQGVKFLRNFDLTSSKFLTKIVWCVWLRSTLVSQKLPLLKTSWRKLFSKQGDWSIAWNSFYLINIKPPEKKGF